MVSASASICEFEESAVAAEENVDLETWIALFPGKLLETELSVCVVVGNSLLGHVFTAGGLNSDTLTHVAVSPTDEAFPTWLGVFSTALLTDCGFTDEMVDASHLAGENFTSLESVFSRVLPTGDGDFPLSAGVPDGTLVAVCIANGELVTLEFSADNCRQTSPTWCHSEPSTLSTG